MIQDEIERYQEQIAQLPAGNITLKAINGKRYPYLQWRDTNTGKQKSRIVKPEELETLTAQIAQRKELERKLKASREAPPHESGEAAFYSSVLRGQELAEFAAPTVLWKKRECYRKLHDYVYGNSTDRVFILYGLRRTGKTTLIRAIGGRQRQLVRRSTAAVR